MNNSDTRIVETTGRWKSNYNNSNNYEWTKLSLEYHKLLLLLWPFMVHRKKAQNTTGSISRSEIEIDLLFIRNKIQHENSGCNKNDEDPKNKMFLITILFPRCWLVLVVNDDDDDVDEHPWLSYSWLFIKFASNLDLSKCFMPSWSQNQQQLILAREPFWLKDKNYNNTTTRAAAATIQ